MLNLNIHYIFWNKVLNQITVRKNKLWRFLPVNSISLAGLGPIPAKELLERRFGEMFGSLNDVLDKITEDEKNVILKSADDTLKHKFDLLGSGPVEMPHINWHADIKTGFQWPKGIYYKDQRKATKKGSDIKIPWELSRCHHLLWVGEAYLMTRDDKYAQEVVDEIEDWLDDNPLMYSVCWTCTMDVAIRAVNWLYSVAMIMPSAIVTQSFIDKFYRSLYQHGWFIFNNFEKTVPYSNNHLFSDYAGLLYLAILFSETKYGRKWIKFTIPEFYEEIRCQTLPSGVNYERSVSYHRLMTELASYPCFLLRRMGYSIPSDIDYRISSMYSFVATYIKDNGRAPLIEDNDDGRFLPFVRRDFRHHNYLLNPNSVENRIIANGLPVFGFEKSLSRLYSDAGHAILRKADAYLFVTNGGFSKYESSALAQGTHTHNDRLSFELSLGKDDVFVDPGAYVYTPDPEKCNEFHSTIKHNTAIVDDEEQNFLSKNNVFVLKKNSLTKCFNLSYDGSCDGEYITIVGEMKHRRMFELNEYSLTIKDILEKKGYSHNYIISYHLAPEIGVEKEDNRVRVITDCYILNLFFNDSNLQVLIEDDTVSPSYGVLLTSKTIRLKGEFNNKCTIETNITWKKK